MPVAIVRLTAIMWKIDVAYKMRVWRSRKAPNGVPWVRAVFPMYDTKQCQENNQARWLTHRHLDQIYPKYYFSLHRRLSWYASFAIDCSLECAPSHAGWYSLSDTPTGLTMKIRLMSHQKRGINGDSSCKMTNWSYFVWGMYRSAKA